jgi:E3 ligase-like protein (putative virulence factor)/Leucine Rich Repeat (LRR) protein
MEYNRAPMALSPILKAAAQVSLPVVLSITAIDVAIKAIYKRLLGPEAGWGDDFATVLKMQVRVVKILTLFSPVLYYYFFKFSLQFAGYVGVTVVTSFVYALYKANEQMVHDTYRLPPGLIYLDELSGHDELLSLVIFTEVLGLMKPVFYFNKQNPHQYDIRLQFNRWWKQQPQEALDRVMDLDLNVYSLPREIVQLKNLTKLRILPTEMFKELPSHIGQCISLRSLVICGTTIRSLPSTFSHLTNLQKLDLSFTLIRSFPSELAGCTSLKSVSFAGCSISAFPQTCVFPKGLKKLNVFDNSLTSLPPWLNQCDQLIKLNASGNRITELPTSLPRNLKKLLLFGNLLTTFPVQIAALNQLETLLLSDNSIETLPESVCFPPSLKVINLSHNRLHTLPDWIFLLPHDVTIDLEGNDFSYETAVELQTRIQSIRQENPNLGPQLVLSLERMLLDDARQIEELAQIIGAQLLSNAQFLSDVRGAAIGEIIPLDRLIVIWLEQVKQEYPQICEKKPDQFPQDSTCPEFYQLLIEEDQNQRNVLSLFLEKLQKTEDYIQGGPGRKNVIYRVFQMLEEGVKNEKFRHLLFPILGEANETCVDCATFWFNRIEIQIHLSRFEDKTALELAKLLIGWKRIVLLEERATARIKQRGMVDPIEVYLYYHIQLKDRLVLPVSTIDMFYKQIGTIPEALLKEDETSVRQAITTVEEVAFVLMQYQEWQACILKTYQEELAGQESLLSADMESLETIENSGEKNTKMKAVAAKREGLTKTFIQEKTKAWVLDNFKSLQNLLALGTND